MASSQRLDTLIKFYQNPYARSLYMTTNDYINAATYETNYEVPPNPNFLSIERVISLPDTLRPSTMYVVQGMESDRADIYFSNVHGSTSRHILNELDIQFMIEETLNRYSNIQVLPTIADRDLRAPTQFEIAFVLDASQDPMVNVGSALYLYNLPDHNWIKVAEFESMDMTYQWDHIQGRPNATVTQIDDTVSRRHSHNNKALLDKVSETPDNVLLYNGKAVPVAISVAEW